MTKSTLALTATLILLAGCSNMSEYYKSVDAANARQIEAVKAQSAADIVRYQALANIASTGDSTAKVAATMALVLGNNGRSTAMAVANQPQNEAIQWASILVPGATQTMSIFANMKQGINASDNATRLGIHTNSTFGQFATEINNPIVVTQPVPIVVRPEVVNQTNTISR